MHSRSPGPTLRSPEDAAGEQVSLAPARPATAAPAPAPAPPSAPRLELTHRRHLLCLGAGDSRGQEDPGQEPWAQHLRSCPSAAPSDSFLSGRRDHLGREQAAPPTRDQRPRATPYTAGDGASGEGATSPERRPSTRPERGLRPPHFRQWFRPDLATPRGGASSFLPDFTLREL